MTKEEWTKSYDLIMTNIKEFDFHYRQSKEAGTKTAQNQGERQAIAIRRTVREHIKKNPELSDLLRGDKSDEGFSMTDSDNWEMHYFAGAMRFFAADIKDALDKL